LAGWHYQFIDPGGEREGGNGARGKDKGKIEVPERSDLPDQTNGSLAWNS
jgi:hypothetical protein